MGNSSIEFPEIGYVEVKGNNKKDVAIDSNANSGNSSDTKKLQRVQNNQSSNMIGRNKQIKELPPKPPPTKKMTVGNGPTKEEVKSKSNFVKEEKPKIRGFFRRSRSNSVDVSKSNHDSTNPIKMIIPNSDTNHDRNRNHSEPATPNLKRSFMNGLISPRFSRHLPFSSKRSSGKFDRSRSSTVNKTKGYDSGKLPTHRENSTISTNTKKSIDISQRLPVSTIGTSYSSMQSLSSIDSQQSGFYSQSSIASYQHHSEYFREQGLQNNRHLGCANLPRDPSIFGPRRTLNGRSNYEHFNSNLFLNINQGKLVNYKHSLIIFLANVFKINFEKYIIDKNLIFHVCINCRHFLLHLLYQFNE